jgi:hypothetical protein
MSIEFDCVQCGQRLRVGDEAAGRPTRCGACQRVQLVPDAPTDQGYELLPDADELPSGPPPLINPYSSPLARESDALDEVGAGQPDGPPWERDHYTLESFFATLIELTFSPRNCFSSMRRQGGHLGPLRFTVMAGIIGFSALTAYGLILTQVFRRAPAHFQPENVSGLLGGFCCCAGILGPLLCITYVFAAAGVFHAALSLCDGANRGWETTFRVVAYSFGTMLMFCVLPGVGPYLTLIAHLIYATVGLAVTHQTSGGKAAVAVWIPSLLGICAFVLMIVAIVWR